MLIWVGFALAILLLLLIARRNLALGMGIAAAVLALFTLSVQQVVDVIAGTLSDPSVLLLALVVGMIPMIGGSLEISGKMDALVENMRIGRKPFLVLGPAILGMLPMPGGALLSAPLVERGAPETPADIKAAANVWFRHALLLVYPLDTSLIASAKIASMDVYYLIPFLFPAFIVALFTGYVLLLRGAGGTISHQSAFCAAGLLVPLGIILAAPAIDLLTKTLFELPYSEIGTAIGVAVSLVLAITIGRLGGGDVKGVLFKMRPWRFSLIILAMFLFLNVFTASGAPEVIASFSLHPVVLCVVIGFGLGLITGRIQAPASIIIPIFVTTHGAMSGAAFAVTYFAIYLGYIITPIHPCISVSVEYFATSMTAFLRKMAYPVAIAAVIDLVVSLFVL